MDEFENSHRFHFFLSSEVLLLSQNYHGYASNPKLESEKTGRRYLDPLAEILGATSSVYFLPKVVSYATLLESKTHPGAFLPLSLLPYRAAQKQRQECSLAPPFHAGSCSSPSPSTADQWCRCVSSNRRKK